MTGSLIALLLLSSQPSEGDLQPSAAASQASADSTPIPARIGAELRTVVRTALRRWAKPSDEEADRAAVAFLRLYDELDKDSELAASQREYFRTKVRLRLLDLSEQIGKRIARQRRLAKAKPQDDQQLPASVELPDDKGRPLAQNAANPGLAGGLGQAGFGRRAGQGGDYGPQLVELIQRTIAPYSWDVNGGPGSIYYWQPGRAIVVRQMDAVHDDIGNLLDQLERANH